jgi:hypothetical protein
MFETVSNGDNRKMDLSSDYLDARVHILFGRYMDVSHRGFNRMLGCIGPHVADYGHGQEE